MGVTDRWIDKNVLLLPIKTQHLKLQRIDSKTYCQLV